MSHVAKLRALQEGVAVALNSGTMSNWTRRQLNAALDASREQDLTTPQLPGQLDVDECIDLALRERGAGAGVVRVGVDPQRDPAADQRGDHDGRGEQPHESSALKRD